MNSKLSPFIVMRIFNHFQVYLAGSLDHVPVNEIYMFSVSNLKIVTAA